MRHLFIYEGTKGWRNTKGMLHVEANTDLYGRPTSLEITTAQRKLRREHGNNRCFYGTIACNCALTFKSPGTSPRTHHDRTAPYKPTAWLPRQFWDDYSLEAQTYRPLDESQLQPTNLVIERSSTEMKLNIQRTALVERLDNELAERKAHNKELIDAETKAMKARHKEELDRLKKNPSAALIGTKDTCLLEERIAMLKASNDKTVELTDEEFRALTNAC